jgi:hypothetical protein
MKFLSSQWSLILLSLFAIPACINGMEIEKPADSQQLVLYKKIHADNPAYTMYSLYLCRGIKGSAIGCADVLIKKKNNTAFLERLEIKRSERQHSYGSFLLKAVLHDVGQQSCVYIKWDLLPFNLRKGESEEQMLPRLLNFYMWHGATVDLTNRASKGMIYMFDPEQQLPKENFIISRL